MKQCARSLKCHASAERAASLKMKPLSDYNKNKTRRGACAQCRRSAMGRCRMPWTLQACTLRAILSAGASRGCSSSMPLRAAAFALPLALGARSIAHSVALTHTSAPAQATIFSSRAGRFFVFFFSRAARVSWRRGVRRWKGICDGRDKQWGRRGKGGGVWREKKGREESRRVRRCGRGEGMQERWGKRGVGRKTRDWREGMGGKVGAGRKNRRGKARKDGGMRGMDVEKRTER